MTFKTIGITCAAIDEDILGLTRKWALTEYILTRENRPEKYSYPGKEVSESKGNVFAQTSNF